MDRGLSPEEYLNDEELGLLRRWLRDKSETDLARGREACSRLRAILETALGTGLRVSESARLNCGDLSLKGSEPCLWVVGSKGRKGTGRNGADSRELVYIPRGLVELLKEFLRWKRTKGEAVGEHDPLFVSERGGRYGVRALELGF